MKKILVFLFDAVRARLSGANVPHNDNLRANQFEERPPFSVYRALVG